MSDKHRGGIEYPGNGRTDFTYYGMNLVESMTNKLADGTVIDSYSYDYDKNGNQTIETHNGQTTSYTYDSMNRLKTVTDPDNTLTQYDFDNAGNISSKTVTHPAGYVYNYPLQDISVSNITSHVTTYSYDTANRLTRAVETVSGSTELTFLDLNMYDKEGNLELNTQVRTNASGPDYTAAFDYDSLNRMTSASINSTSVTYGYDGNGMRISKTVGSSETTRYYLSGSMVVNETFNGAESASNILGSGIIGRITSGSRYMMMKNAHGDVVSLVRNGALEARYDYDAYGNETQNTNESINNPIRYAGEYLDEETGFIYLRARYYDPGIGRFISEDPIRDGLNWYVYCENNPLMFVDPSGLSITLTGITSKEYDERFLALQALTDDELDVNLETGEVSYLPSDQVDREIATNLVRDIIDNQDIVCEINIYDEPNGGTGYTFDSEGNVTKTHVYFNPEYTPSQWSYVEGEGYGNRTKPAFMVLGHELVHVVRRMNGVERDRSNSGYYLSGPQSGDALMRNGKPEELETTGIDYVKVVNGNWANTTRVEASKYYYSENALRLEYDRIHQNDLGYVKMGRRAAY